MYSYQSFKNKSLWINFISAKSDTESCDELYFLKQNFPYLKESLQKLSLHIYPKLHLNEIKT